jgi:uncharacterized protein (DUF1697 family)
MAKYVALLRAINVGGTGKLPMTDLKAMCEDAGFAHVQTYIASGNVVFESNASPAKVKSELEKRLHAYAGKPMGVVLRTASEMVAVAEANPFPKAGTQPGCRNLPRRSAAGGRIETRSRRKGREDASRQTRDLRPLRQRDRDIQIANPRRQGRHHAQHEHHREACRTGVEDRLEVTSAPRMRST